MKGITYAHARRLLACFLATSPLFGRAADPPTAEELVRAHAELRRASSRVQGEITEFWTDEVVPAALEKSPKELRLPLIVAGKLWRSEQRFRADYIVCLLNRQPPEFYHAACAVDEGKVYRFKSGVSIDKLQIYDSDSAELADALNYVKFHFYQPIDALWSRGGVPFVDMLQRPGAMITANSSEYAPGGFGILVPAQGDASATLVELGAGKNRPFQYLMESAGADRWRTNVERRVYAKQFDGMFLPSRVVEVASLGADKGYTKVVELDLKPLVGISPISEKITEASFKNLGQSYQAYKYGKGGEEQVGNRYEAADEPK